MDYAEGVSLKEFIHINSPLKIATAVSIIEQLLSIMSVCHQKKLHSSRYKTTEHCY